MSHLDKLSWAWGLIFNSWSITDSTVRGDLFFMAADIQLNDDEIKTIRNRVMQFL